MIILPKYFLKMKKSIFFTLLLVSVLSVQAQRFTGGFMAGVVGSQVDGDTYSGYDKAGALLGGYINIKFHDYYAFQMELEYSMKGSRHIANPDKGDYNTYKLNVNYISVPVLFQYNFYKSFIGEAGLESSILLSHKEISNDVTLDGPEYPGFATQNLSIIFGVSYKINDIWKVNIRTDNSLFSIRTKPANGLLPGGYIKRFWENEYGQFHNSIAISAFYRL